MIILNKYDWELIDKTFYTKEFIAFNTITKKGLIAAIEKDLKQERQMQTFTSDNTWTYNVDYDYIMSLEALKNRIKYDF